MLFTCPRFDKCPRNCYVLLNDGHVVNRSKQHSTAATDHVHIDKTTVGLATKISNLKRVRSIIDYIGANSFITNSDINKRLRKQLLPQLSVIQLTNLRQRIKTTNQLTGVQNSSKSHLGDLMNWAKSSREVPFGPDDIFYSISSTSSTQLTNKSILIAYG